MKYFFLIGAFNTFMSPFFQVVLVRCTEDGMRACPRIASYFQNKLNIKVERREHDIAGIMMQPGKFIS